MTWMGGVPSCMLASRCTWKVPPAHPAITIINRKPSPAAIPEIRTYVTLTPPPHNTFMYLRRRSILLRRPPPLCGDAPPSLWSSAAPCSSCRWLRRSRGKALPHPLLPPSRTPQSHTSSTRCRPCLRHGCFETVAVACRCEHAHRDDAVCDVTRCEHAHRALG